MPRELRLVRNSVSGAHQFGNTIFFNGTLFAANPPTVDVITDTAPFGYVSLASLGVTPLGCPSNCDDGGFIFSGLDVNYLGQNYTEVILSVNGTLELGTASGVAASATNQNLPDPGLPNNVLAPWWTDLNLGAGGNWYAATLTAGPDTYLVFEWENVPRFGDLSSTFTFQVWLQQGTDNIWFVYDGFVGDTSDGTVGAENSDGTFGDTVYFDGVGTLPWGGPDDLRAASIPGAPGETHTITFSARGWRIGSWTNCAEMTSDLFQGKAIGCFTGSVEAH